MTEPNSPHPSIEKVALATADRLSVDHGPQLHADVLAALHAPNRNPDQYLDPIALASLIVSAATLAWTIYQDLRTKNQNPNPETIARRVRLELTTETRDMQHRDKIIKIAVEEITERS